MIIIPSINLQNEENAEKIFSKLKIIKQSRQIANVHIDISDGKFTHTKTISSPLWFLEKIGKDFNFFVHFMVDDLESYLKEWAYLPNLKKISLHLNSHFDVDNLMFIADKNNIDLELVLGLEDNLEEFLEMVLFYKCKSVQFLAVPPGPSGQSFDYSILEKIKIFKAEIPSVIVFVDGGVNDKNIKEIKETKAEGVVVGSYLWGSEDPVKAFDSLI